MIEQYIDVIRDDVRQLLCKRGRASDSEYILILKRIDILNEEITNDTKSRLSNRMGSSTTKETEG